MKKTTITYFEPFGGRKTNSSKEIALAMSDEFEKFELPVSWNKVPDLIEEILSSKPRYLFMFGENDELTEPVVEIKAKNNCDGQDEYGEKKDDEKILLKAPKKLFTNFHLPEEGLNKSEDAGKYLCNYSYYHALNKTQVTKVVFIHLPLLHSKGSRKKECILEKVIEMINTILENDKGFLVEVDNGVKEINEENVRELYPLLKDRCSYPNIIVGINRHEDGSFNMSGRMDGYRGFWYEFGNNKEEENPMMNRIYYRIASYFDGLTEEDKENDEIIERNHHFESSEYFGLRKEIRAQMNKFICHADYTDEVNFYRSLDEIHCQLIKEAKDEGEKLLINNSKDYISRMGLEETKLILLKLARR